MRAWLTKNHTTSKGIWVKIYKKRSGIKSVGFDEMLDLGLCFGWSESVRHKGEDGSDKYYLQKFTPRKSPGTTSKRNMERALELNAKGLMTHTGRVALGLQ
jgi:uncharacterized protein YdeI (YjbR/CyaY-like superfamily)